MSLSMYKIYNNSLLNAINNESDDEYDDIMSAYETYAKEKARTAKKFRFRICTDEITAMFALRDGQIPRMVTPIR